MRILLCLLLGCVSVSSALSAEREEPLPLYARLPAETAAATLLGGLGAIVGAGLGGLCISFDEMRPCPRNQLPGAIGLYTGLVLGASTGAFVVAQANLSGQHLWAKQRRGNYLFAIAGTVALGCLSIFGAEYLNSPWPLLLLPTAAPLATELSLLLFPGESAVAFTVLPPGQLLVRF